MIEAIPWTGLAQFSILVGLLFLVSALGLVWVQAGWAAIGLGIRAAVKVGLYQPNTGQRKMYRKRDVSILAFSKALRSVSSLIPGEPPHSTRTIILPMLFVGAPLCLLMVASLIVLPIMLFLYILWMAPGWSSFPLALGGVAAYYLLVAMLQDIGKRVYQVDDRAQVVLN